MASKPKPPILILDGGLGTALQAIPEENRCELDASLWSSTPLFLDPALLTKVHEDFIHSGADIVSTATYQINFPGVVFMDRHDAVPVITLEGAKKYMRSAVRLARTAADDNVRARGGERAKVALALGPYGATMQPSTEYSAQYDNRHDTMQKLREWHMERLSVFAEDPTCWRDVDYVAFETFGRCDEIKAVRQVMSDLFGQGVERKKWWISCVFPEDADGALPSGEDVDEAVETMLEVVVEHGGRELEKPGGIGINCTKVSHLRGLLDKFEKAVEIVLAVGEEWPALILYPDGTKKGEHYDSVRREWVVDSSVAAEGDEKPWHEELKEIVEDAQEKPQAPWKRIVVGGCCRAGPEQIRALRNALQSRYS